MTTRSIAQAGKTTIASIYFLSNRCPGAPSQAGHLTSVPARHRSGLQGGIALELLMTGVCSQFFSPEAEGAPL